MVNWINKQKPQLEYINFFAGIILVFMIPFHSDYVRIPVFLNLWAFTWLLEGNFKAKYRQNINRHNKKILLIGTGFFLIHLIALMWTKNISEGIFDVQMKLSLMIAPIALLTANQLYKKYFEKILMSFIIGNLVAAVICLVNAFIKSWGYTDGELIFKTVPALGYENFFTYSNLSVFLHPTYFSIDITFVVTILFLFLNKPVLKNSKLQKPIFIILIVFFSIILILLMSRAGIFIGFFLALVWILIYFYRIRKILIGAFLIILLLGSLFYLVFRSERMTAISENIKNKNHQSIKERILASDTRFSVWNSAVKVVEEHPFLGVGVGDVKEELIKKYEQNNFKKGIVSNLDAHNQYLESWIAVGLPGFMLLVTLLFLSIKESVHNKNMLLFFLTLIILFHFIFESLLNQISGISFIAFFLYYLNFNSDYQSNIKTGL